MLITVKIESEALAERLRELGNTGFRRAIRNALRDTAKDVLARERLEMQRVFDRPTPFILRGLRITKLPQMDDLSAEVGLADAYGTKYGVDIVGSVLSPHIPGLAATRNYKGMERALQHAGLMQKGQWLMPSRSMRLDRYGNVPGSVASKMLNDVRAFANRSGFTSSTGQAKVRYLWATMETSRGKITGIWDRNKLRNKDRALEMVVVNKPPTYAKRFRFHDVARSHVATVWPGRAAESLRYALQGRRAGPS